MGMVRLDINSENPKLTPIRLAASWSLSGSMMESSYRMQAITPKIPVIEMKRARMPNASGAYKRVKRGADKTVIAWAIDVPVVNFSTSPAKVVFLLFERGISWISSGSI